MIMFNQLHVNMELWKLFDEHRYLNTFFMLGEHVYTYQLHLSIILVIQSINILIAIINIRVHPTFNDKQLNDFSMV